MIRKKYALVCNGCGVELDGTHKWYGVLEMWAVDQGWQRKVTQAIIFPDEEDLTEHYCPSCIPVDADA